MDRREHLKRLLREHRPTDEQEQRHLARMLALIEAVYDPFSRDHYAPGHFTASAFVLSPDEASVLLIFHGKLHRWLQPGGHVDPRDRTILDTAVRELREETSVEGCEPWPAVFDIDVHEIPAHGSAPAHEHFDVRFLLRSASVHVHADSDAVSARWVHLQDMDTLESDASVLRAIGKIHRALGGLG